MKIDALRRKKLISQHRFQLRHRSVLLKAKPLSRISAGQTRHCADRPCLRFLNGLKSGPGVEPELVCRLFPDLSRPLSGQIYSLTSSGTLMRVPSRAFSAFSMSCSKSP